MGAGRYRAYDDRRAWARGAVQKSAHRSAHEWTGRDEMAGKGSRVCAEVGCKGDISDTQMTLRGGAREAAGLVMVESRDANGLACRARGVAPAGRCRLQAARWPGRGEG